MPGANEDQVENAGVEWGQIGNRTEASESGNTYTQQPQ